MSMFLRYKVIYIFQINTVSHTRKYKERQVPKVSSRNIHTILFMLPLD